MPFLCHSLKSFNCFFLCVLLTGGGNKRKEHNVKVEVNFPKTIEEKENVKRNLL